MESQQEIQGVKGHPEQASQKQQQESFAAGVGAVRQSGFDEQQQGDGGSRDTKYAGKIQFDHGVGRAVKNLPEIIAICVLGSKPVCVNEFVS